MATIAEMTQLSPTMTEGTIVNWLKKEGDSVSSGEIIAEVETDKAIMEMEAYDSGILLAILANAGSKVLVGHPIAIIGDKDEDISGIKKSIEQKITISGELKQNTLSNVNNKLTNDTSNISQIRINDTKEFNESEVTNIQSAIHPKSLNRLSSINSGRILASPLARSVAIQKSVDLKYVQGSGPSGRILQRDVYAFIESGSQATGKSGRKENIHFPSSVSLIEPNMNNTMVFTTAISSMRKTIAERLTSSKTNIPHYYLNIEIDAEPIVVFRNRFNQGIQSFQKNINLVDDKPQLKLSINDIIVKAAALSLERHPILNSSWREDHIQISDSIDIGIAVSIPDGLITPVIRSANNMSLLAISQGISILGSKAKERKLKPEEFTNSSFTISNLGMYGISFFTAIINEPESAILAVGSIEDKPVVKSGTLVPGKTLQLTLSCDHRVVDGVEGAKFLQTLRKILESPELLS